MPRLWLCILLVYVSVTWGLIPRSRWLISPTHKSSRIWATGTPSTETSITWSQRLSQLLRRSSSPVPPPPIVPVSNGSQQSLKLGLKNVPFLERDDALQTAAVQTAIRRFNQHLLATPASTLASQLTDALQAASRTETPVTPSPVVTKGRRRSKATIQVPTLSPVQQWLQFAALGGSVPSEGGVISSQEEAALRLCMWRNILWYLVDDEGDESRGPVITANAWKALGQAVEKRTSQQLISEKATGGVAISTDGIVSRRTLRQLVLDAATIVAVWTHAADDGTCVPGVDTESMKEIGGPPAVEECSPAAEMLRHITFRRLSRLTLWSAVILSPDFTRKINPTGEYLRDEWHAKQLRVPLSLFPSTWYDAWLREEYSTAWLPDKPLAQQEADAAVLAEKERLIAEEAAEEASREAITLGKLEDWMRGLLSTANVTRWDSVSETLRPQLKDLSPSAIARWNSFAYGAYFDFATEAAQELENTNANKEERVRGQEKLLKVLEAIRKGLLLGGGEVAVSKPTRIRDGDALLSAIHNEAFAGLARIEVRDLLATAAAGEKDAWETSAAHLRATQERLLYSNETMDAMLDEAISWRLAEEAAGVFVVFNSTRAATVEAEAAAERAESEADNIATTVGSVPSASKVRKGALPPPSLAQLGALGRRVTTRMYANNMESEPMDSSESVGDPVVTHILTATRRLESLGRALNYLRPKYHQDSLAGIVIPRPDPDAPVPRPGDELPSEPTIDSRLAILRHVQAAAVYEMDDSLVEELRRVEELWRNWFGLSHDETIEGRTRVATELLRTHLEERLSRRLQFVVQKKKSATDSGFDETLFAAEIEAETSALAEQELTGTGGESIAELLSVLGKRLDLTNDQLEDIRQVSLQAVIRSVAAHWFVLRDGAPLPSAENITPAARLDPLQADELLGWTPWRVRHFRLAVATLGVRADDISFLRTQYRIPENVSNSTSDKESTTSRRTVAVFAVRVAALETLYCVALGDEQGRKSIPTLYNVPADAVTLATESLSWDLLAAWSERLLGSITVDDSLNVDSERLGEALCGWLRYGRLIRREQLEAALRGAPSVDQEDLQFSPAVRTAVLQAVEEWLKTKFSKSRTAADLPVELSTFLPNIKNNASLKNSERDEAVRNVMSHLTAGLVLRPSYDTPLLPP